MTNDTFRPRTINQLRADGSTKRREIHIPSPQTLQVHRQMLKALENLNMISHSATGGVKGKNILDHNVKPHRYSDNFYMADIQNAYSSVDTDKLKDLVREMVDDDYVLRDEVISFIDNWATHPEIPGLPLGAPCSPILFNMYCAPLDSQIERIAADNDITYTRYLDDITLSSSKAIGAPTRKAVAQAVNDQGMELNQSKTKRYRLGPHAVTITGVSIYPDRRLQVSPAILEKTQACFKEAIAIIETGGIFSAEEIGRIHGLHGSIHQLTSGESYIVQKLDRMYDKIKRHLPEYDERLSWYIPN